MFEKNLCKTCLVLSVSLIFPMKYGNTQKERLVKTDGLPCLLSEKTKKNEFDRLYQENICGLYKHCHITKVFNNFLIKDASECTAGKLGYFEAILSIYNALTLDEKHSSLRKYQIIAFNQLVNRAAQNVLFEQNALEYYQRSSTAAQRYQQTREYQGMLALCILYSIVGIKKYYILNHIVINFSEGTIVPKKSWLDVAKFFKEIKKIKEENDLQQIVNSLEAQIKRILFLITKTFQFSNDYYYFVNHENLFHGFRHQIKREIFKIKEKVESNSKPKRYKEKIIDDLYIQIYGQEDHKDSNEDELSAINEVVDISQIQDIFQKIKAFKYQ